MNARWLSLMLSAGLFWLIIDLTRQGRLTFKYAVGWMALAAAGMLSAVFDHVLYSWAAALGFHLTSNFIFFCGLLGLVVLSVLMTVFLCQQNARNDQMAQKIALLELEVTALKDSRKE